MLGGEKSPPRFFPKGLVDVLLSDVISAVFSHPIHAVSYSVIKFLKDSDLYNELDIYLENLLVIELEAYLETRIQH